MVRVLPLQATERLAARLAVADQLALDQLHDRKDLRFAGGPDRRGDWSWCWSRLGRFRPCGRRIQCDVHVSDLAGTDRDLAFEGDNRVSAESKTIGTGHHAREIDLTTRVGIPASIGGANHFDVHSG